MSQIDISQWKEFKVGKLFDFYRGKEAAPKRVPEGNIPMINETQENNGVAKQADSEHVFPGNSITVSVNYASTVFYQPKDFCASVNIIILHNDYLNDARGKFIAAMLSKYNQRFSYTNKISQQKLKEIKLPLPVDKNGDPNWQYMDTYIAKLTTLAHENVSSLKQSKAKPAKINIDHWGEFKVSDILSRIPVKKTSYKATDLVKEADSINTIPLVAAGVNNQGVTGYAPTDNLTILQNCLTVSANGANSGTVFYQNRRFSILQDAYALELIDKAYRIDTVYIYLASLLTKLLMQNDWTNKATWNIVKDKHIKLPIDAKSEPDWEYMDNQVRHFATISNLTIASLRSVI